MFKPILLDCKSLLPDALSASAFQKAGREWKPDLCFTGALDDVAQIRLLRDMLKKSAEGIIAYKVSPYRSAPIPAGTSFPGTVGVTLQFADTTAGQIAYGQCMTDYRMGSSRHRQDSEWQKAIIHARLYCNRFYRLPDGRQFLCLGKWDCGRFLWGKVLLNVNNDGTCDLASEIVARETLIKCQLIPRNEESFTLALEPLRGP